MYTYRNSSTKLEKAYPTFRVDKHDPEDVPRLDGTVIGTADHDIGVVWLEGNAVHVVAAQTQQVSTNQKIESILWKKGRGVPMTPQGR